jgi:AbrB family looped-hinge helix DNA binding protein
MPVATISSKGQITLPAAFRRKLRMKPHDRVMVDVGDDAITIKRAPDFMALRGTLGKALPLVEEKRRMMKAVADHVLGRDE